MIRLAAKIIIAALAVLAASQFVNGIEVRSFTIALLVALVLGLVNVVLRPIVLLFTLPINIATLGLFTLVVNALMFWLAAGFVRGFEVSGFAAAFFGALIVSVASYVGSKLISKPEED